MANSPTAESSTRQRHKQVLVGSVLIAGMCSIVYELLISTTVSYFLGDSVRQFSITIGLYMAAMGLGSWVSRYITRDLLLAFIGVEILLALVGGLCVPLLYVAYAYTDLIQVVMLALIIAVGALTGLEVPLLTRALEHEDALSRNLSNVLSLDYLGALLATLAFPFLLVPFLGVFRSSLVFGLINLALGVLNLWYFSAELGLRRPALLRSTGIAVAVFMGTLLAFSQGLLSAWTNSLYSDRVVYQEQTAYQKIVMTQYKDDLRLFLNGNLQFSSIDEYRYHEALVHMPLSAHPKPRHVLVLGGGDGMAIRELLKYDSIESIDQVELDPAMIDLGRDNPKLRDLNQDSMRDPRVATHARDAMVFLEDVGGQYDAVFVDLPDPNNVSLARLYSREFYRLIRSHMTQNAVFVTQATSPYYATKTFWSIKRSVAAAGFSRVTPYHVEVPSFGDWGFVYASTDGIDVTAASPAVPTRYLATAQMKGMLRFAADERVDRQVASSSLDKPAVHRYYMEGWSYWH